MMKGFKALCIILAAALVFLLIPGTARADERTENEKLGYFSNTRTVLMLPMEYQGNDGYCARYFQNELNQIFKYPYYRQVDGSQYAGTAPADLPKLAEQTGSDIVILPRAYWYQVIFGLPSPWDDDYDPIVRTRVAVEVFSYKTGDVGVRDDKASYFNEDDISGTRSVYIMDEVMKRFYKKFPYRRVPTDISKNLSGDVETKENNTKTTYVPGTEQPGKGTPTAPMNK